MGAGLLLITGPSRARPTCLEAARHGTLDQAGPARARWPLCHAMLGLGKKPDFRPDCRPRPAYSHFYDGTSEEWPGSTGSLEDWNRCPAPACTIS
jgi:hypothetical protein